MKNFETRKFLFNAVILSFALVGAAHLAGISGSMISAPAAAKSDSRPEVEQAGNVVYFPDLFVNRGTEREESYIAQF